MRFLLPTKLIVIPMLWLLSQVLLAESQQLPWDREIQLSQAAQTVFLENILNPVDPLPDRNSYPLGKAMAINNLKMRTTLWGPTERVTISLTKNNVWDRRLNARALEAPKLQEMVAGAYSPANKDFKGKADDCQRTWGYGYLLEEGGLYDPYRQPHEYPMPCLKPVGQIIIGMDALAGAEAPRVTQSCANGRVELQETKGRAKANVQYILGMTSNIYAVRGEYSGMDTPVWLRLYRHRDTSHMGYMNAEGTIYTKEGTAADSAFNYLMDPPTSGSDGRYFWIRQHMPSEKTFPLGFQYVLMGLVITQGEAVIETVEGKTGLGTPPPDNSFNSEAEYLERYPGDDYVDLVGMDNYSDFESNRVEAAAVKLKIISDYADAHNKLSALTECGYRNTPKPIDLYTNRYLTALTTYPIKLSFMMFWVNNSSDYYVPTPDESTANNFRAFANHLFTLLHGDVQNPYESQD